MPDGLTDSKYVIVNFAASRSGDWKNAHVGRTIETAGIIREKTDNAPAFAGRFLQGFRVAWPVFDKLKFGIDFVSSDAAPAQMIEEKPVTGLFILPGKGLSIISPTGGNELEDKDVLSLQPLDDWQTPHDAAMKALKDGEQFSFADDVKMPGGTSGILTRGSRLGDFKNHIFFPAGGPLIAHHRMLDPGKFSSRVYEIDSRSLDKKNYGHLDDVFRVLGTPDGVCGLQGNYQVTLNFTASEGHGTGWGAVSFGATPTEAQKERVITGHTTAQAFIQAGAPEAQGSARVVAYMSNESKAGPIAKGFTKCQHWIADALDGTAHQSAHISTGALFTHGTHRVLFDGPLPFSNRIAPETLGGEYPVETTIEWDPRQGHTGPCGKPGEGRWKLITRIPIYKFDPSGGTRPNDPSWTMMPDPIKTHGEIGQGWPCENPKKQMPVDPFVVGGPIDRGGRDGFFGGGGGGGGGTPGDDGSGSGPNDPRFGGLDVTGGGSLNPFSEIKTPAESNNMAGIPAVSFTANFAEFKDCSRREYNYTSPPFSPGGLDTSAGGSLNPYSHIPGNSNGIKMEAPAVFATLCTQHGGEPLQEDFDTTQIPGGVPDFTSAVYSTSRYGIGYLSCDRSYLIGWTWGIEGDCLNFERLDSDGAELAGELCINGDPIGTNPSTADQCCVTQAAHGLAVGDVVYKDSADNNYKKADASDSTKLPSGIVSSVSGNDICVTSSGPIDCLSVTDDEGNALTDGLYMASSTTPGKLRNPEGALGIPANAFVAYEKRGSCCRVVEMNVGYTFGSGGGGSFDCGQMEACPAFTTLVTRVDDLECPPESVFDDGDFPITLDETYCGEVVTVALDSSVSSDFGDITLPLTTDIGTCCCITIKYMDTNAGEPGKGTFDVIGAISNPTGSPTTDDPIDGKSGGVTMTTNQAVTYCYSPALGVWRRQ